MQPIKNTGSTVRYIGGRAVLPGETVLVDEAEVPGLKEPDPVVEPVLQDADEFIEAILGGNVASVAKAMLNLLADELDALEQAELASEHTRKGVLSAIDQERLARADFMAEVEQAEAGDLQGFLDEHSERKGFIEIVVGAISPEVAQGDDADV